MGRYAQLTESQIWQAISESHEAIAGLIKYQRYLSTGSGLPKNDEARIQLMASNVKLVQKIQSEIKELQKELERRP